MVFEPIPARGSPLSSSGAAKLSSIPAGGVARSRHHGGSCPGLRRVRGHRVAGRPGRETVAGWRVDAVADRGRTLSARLIRSQAMRSRRRLATANLVARFGVVAGVGLRRGTACHASLWGCRSRFRPVCTAETPETFSRTDPVHRIFIRPSCQFITVSDHLGNMRQDECPGADPPLLAFVPPPVARLAEGLRKAGTVR